MKITRSRQHERKQRRVRREYERVASWAAALTARARLPRLFTRPRARVRATESSGALLPTERESGSRRRRPFVRPSLARRTRAALLLYLSLSLARAKELFVLRRWRSRRRARDRPTNCAPPFESARCCCCMLHTRIVRRCSRWGFILSREAAETLELSVAPPPPRSCARARASERGLIYLLLRRPPRRSRRYPACATCIRIYTYTARGVVWVHSGAWVFWSKKGKKGVPASSYL